MDIARDIVVSEGSQATGVIVLDGYGGLHPSSGLSAIGTRSPYWGGWNIARAITRFEPAPRGGGKYSETAVQVTGIGFANKVTLTSISLDIPYAAFALSPQVYMEGSALIWNSTATIIEAGLCLSIDNQTCLAGTKRITNVRVNSNEDEESLSTSATYPLIPGKTVYLLGWSENANATFQQYTLNSIMVYRAIGDGYGGSQ